MSLLNWNFKQLEKYEKLIFRENFFENEKYFEQILNKKLLDREITLLIM